MYKYYFLPLAVILFAGPAFAQGSAKKLLESAERQALRRAETALVPAAAKAAFAKGALPSENVMRTLGRQLEAAVRQAALHARVSAPVPAAELDLRRVLLVAAFRREPGFESLAHAGNREAARSVARGFAAQKRREQLGGTLSVNGWVVVLTSRLEEAFTNRSLTAKMTREMEAAHEMAVKVYEQTYGVHNSEFSMYATPEFKDLLAEAMAQRLNAGVFDELSFIERARFMQVFIREMLSSPVNITDLNLAILRHEELAGLRIFQEIDVIEPDVYKEVKKHLKDCALMASAEAQWRGAVSEPELKMLFFDKVAAMESFCHAAALPGTLDVWKKLIAFYNHRYKSK